MRQERLLSLIVLMLSIVVVVVIIILQQFDDVNALQPPIFIQLREKNSEHPLMDYPAYIAPSLLHWQ